MRWTVDLGKTMTYNRQSIMQKHSSSILSLARRGAEVRWTELESERADLLKTFPDLGTLSSGVRGTGPRRRRTLAAPSNDRAGHTTRRGKMSAAARRAVSRRMKKYWAARRAAKSAQRRTAEK